MATVQERLSTAQWVLERQLAWIAQAELKAGAVLTVQLALLGGVSGLYAAATPTTGGGVVLCALVALLALVSAFCAGMVVKPRVSGPVVSLLFFGKVVEIDEGEYAKRFRNVSNDDLLLDWSVQIHRNAAIANDKHRWVARAVQFGLAAGFALAPLAAVLLATKGK